MSMQIVGDVDPNRLFCTGSFTKLLTTYVCLSLLSEKYSIPDILDDDHFLDKISQTKQAKEFLNLFQNLIGNKFSLHDVCSYYAGLPYTFDVSEQELEQVELGHPFKHHHIFEETTFLTMCRNNITPIYTSKCKFHYSEISIIFLGYLIEKIYNLKIEDLYQRYILSRFQLKQSTFSRTKVPTVYCQDLSPKYDYPSVAILDHGYFCYSNGFFTTLNDMKIIIEHLLHEPIFHIMTDMTHVRAASTTIMNGLAVELRKIGDDIIYGYEGLSYSGCNIWAYSTKHNRGYLTFTEDEEAAYPAIYDLWNYTKFDNAPDHAHQIYQNFIKNYSYNEVNIDIPEAYQGHYRRVNPNESNLDLTFTVGNDFIVIRNPDEIKYPIMYLKNRYWIKGKGNINNAQVGFKQSKSGQRYMYHDGTLYRKV